MCKNWECRKGKGSFGRIGDCSWGSDSGCERVSQFVRVCACVGYFCMLVGEADGEAVGFFWNVVFHSGTTSIFSSCKGVYVCFNSSFRVTSLVVDVELPSYLTGRTPWL